MIAIKASLIICAIANLQAAVNLGSVTGTVSDSTGKPLPGVVRVFLSLALPADGVRQPAPPVQTGPHVTSRLADKNGSFTIGTLAPGSYIACASTSTMGYLDPCQWATTAPAFSVTAGQVTPNVKIMLAKGAVIPFRVNDAPQKLLTAQNNAHDLDFQIHVVTASNRHYTALIVNQDTSGRDHAVTIPFGVPVTLQLFTPKLTVTESTGKLTAPGGLKINVPQGTTPATIVLNVTGVK